MASSTGLKTHDLAKNFGLGEHGDADTYYKYELKRKVEDPQLRAIAIEAALYLDSKLVTEFEMHKVSLMYANAVVPREMILAKMDIEAAINEGFRVVWEGLTSGDIQRADDVDAYIEDHEMPYTSIKKTTKDKVFSSDVDSDNDSASRISDHLTSPCPFEVMETLDLTAEATDEDLKSTKDKKDNAGTVEEDESEAKDEDIPMTDATREPEQKPRKKRTRPSAVGLE